MRSSKIATLLALLIATASHAASHNQKPTAHSNGRSSSSIEKKSSGNNDNQWQADPERGWVRSGELGNRKDQRTSAKQNGDKKSKQEKHNKWFF